ncbi:MAG TPA: ABC-2 family transporter protein [Fimbriimonadaceae bacterium]|nr:ABC-2 family transporter protein [Fimbriimonadaceae bacterium]
MALSRPSLGKWRLWSALLSVFFQDGVAYRAQGVIWILTDVTVLLVMPLVWISASKGGPINGFSTADFVNYYLCVVLITQFVQSHFMWDVAFEIREGVFSAQIVRPVNWLEFMLVRNLAWRCIRLVLFLPWFLVFAFAYRGYLGAGEFHLTWQFFLSVVLGHSVSVMTVLAMSLIALFVQEAQTIFEIYYLPMLFLSGQMFPVALYPAWAQKLSSWLPFYYTVGAPTDILVGRTHGAHLTGVLLAQVAWVLAMAVAFRLMWRFGLRHYTGVGM